MAELTAILRSVERGECLAEDVLLPLVYDELRKLAAAKLSQEAPGQTLQPTALVHEAYLRLVTDEDEPSWKNRGHFFAAAAEAMRRILVDRARRKASVKHGGGMRRIEMDAELISDEGRAAELLALNDALAELEGHDSQAAQVVKLRYFAGLSLQETADVMQICRRTADRHWALAKAWLYRQLS
jgi:RNA polymerase sigma factor (TIGR02999 family)